jgi:peptidoglycan hydrolase CwlO-like protein
MKLSEHMEKVQGPASYWIDEVKQLESSLADKDKEIEELKKEIERRDNIALNQPGITVY